MLNVEDYSSKSQFERAVAGAGRKLVVLVGPNLYIHLPFLRYYLQQQPERALSYQYNCHSRTPRVYSCTPNIFLSRAMTETGIKTWFLRAHHCIPTERVVALDEQLSWLRV